MRIAETVTFGAGRLQRAAHLRAEPPVEDALVLPLWRGKPLLSEEGISWLDGAIVPVEGPEVFLGVEDGRPLYARDVSGWEPDDVPDSVGAFLDPSEQVHPGLPGAFAELRARMTRLTPRDAEMAATAKALLGWHATHRFCARCGERTDMAEAGWQRRCPACGARHFPRTDPVVIMLITQDNSVLVGRSPGWPDGIYSLLAGFVEPGETLEAAVRREVLEEAGVSVGEVTYLASQPWPFPSSLMIGCRGEARGREITLDPVELDDARWLSREETADVFAGTHPDVLPARPGAIARFLLHAWLADRLD
jgi:NAD+ diphosphatase